MKRKIKSILATVAVMTVVITAGAQPRHEEGRRSPEDRAKIMVEKMTEELGLTEQQQKQVMDLYKEMAPQGERADRQGKPERNKGERPAPEDIEKMKAEKETKMEQRKAEMKFKMEEHSAKMQAILTPEQFEKWQENIKNMPARHQRPEARNKDDKRQHRHPASREHKQCDCEIKG